ncbi:PilZ domain-containing protein [Altererythrobacter sp.]|uniref:PilZ domain-containing protein n=1 Tax=Altererythrobacter sp. TaxID=1872480 RepID=UPI003D0370CE
MSHDRRRSQRYHLRLGLRTSSSVGDSVAVVTNISNGGLNLLCSEPPGVGETILVEFPDNPPMAARVIWSDGRSTGCEFSYALTDHQLSAILELGEETEPLALAGFDEAETVERWPGSVRIALILCLAALGWISIAWAISS